MKRIAVTGATGYIGGRLVPRLLDAGYAVRCLVRSPRKLQDRAWSRDRNVQVAQADLSDAQSLTESLTGCDAAFFLVHSMNSASAEYAKRDLQLATAFARASKRAGVRRIIYLGGLGETGAGLSEHLTSRRQVEKALASTGVPVTVLRAAMIIGSGSASFEILRYLVERLPVMVTPKWVRTPCQPIAVRNVIGYLVGVLSSPETAGRTFDIGGPEVLSYLQIMRIMAEELGLRKRLVVPVPVLTPRLSSYWIHLVTPLGHNIAKPLAEGLRNPVVCREDHITHILPQKLLTVRESVAAARGKIAEHAVETSWTMAGEVAGTIPGDPKWAGGTVFHDIRQVHIAAPPAAVFKAVCLLGGDHGWYSAAWLWRIRGWMDVLAGGPGLRRGRLHPETLAYGEPLDFWRVVGIEKDRSLTLRAEMKLPGEALLEFCVTPDGDGESELEQRALFKPRGLLGILYWYGVLPFHGFVFSGMLTGIITEALEFARDSRNISNQLVDTK
ncbi:MAG: SDR family oxidoreductase [Candidatus Acidiferrales bacterium]